MALIKDTGGRTSHSPPLEMAMAHGFPAIQEALDHGLRPSLSSDHSATVAQDMFGMMRTRSTCSAWASCSASATASRTCRRC